MNKIFAFIAGAAVGAAITAMYLKSKFEENYSEFSAAVGDVIDIPEVCKAETEREEHGLRRITETEFGAEDDYETGTLYRYLDGTVTDSNNEPVDPIDIPGIDEFACSDDMEEYSEELYLRDDKHKIYYEILLVDRNYGDGVGVI